MEPDRYADNKPVFVIAMICLLASLSLFAFSFYLFPYLFFNWNYKVPLWVPAFVQWLIDDYAMSTFLANFIVFLSFFVPALLTGFISKIASNKIDNHIYGLTPQKQEAHVHMREEVKASMGFGLKLILMIVGAVVVVLLLEWVIQSPPQPAL